MDFLKANARQLVIGVLAIGVLVLLHFRPDLKDLVASGIAILGALGLHLPEIRYGSDSGLLPPEPPGGDDEPLV